MRDRGEFRGNAVVGGGMEKNANGTTKALARWAGELRGLS